MESEAEKLEFSYKYPFSNAAMEIIAVLQSLYTERITYALKKPFYLIP